MWLWRGEYLAFSDWFFAGRGDEIGQLSVINQVLVIWADCFRSYLASWVVTRDSRLTPYKPGWLSGWFSGDPRWVSWAGCFRLWIRVLCLSVAWPPSICTLSLSFPREWAVSHSCDAPLQAKAHNPASPHSFLPLAGLASPHVAQQHGLFPLSFLKHPSYLAYLDQGSPWHSKPLCHHPRCSLWWRASPECARSPSLSAVFTYRLFIDRHAYLLYGININSSDLVRLPRPSRAQNSDTAERCLVNGSDAWWPKLCFRKGESNSSQLVRRVSGKLLNPRWCLSLPGPPSF